MEHTVNSETFRNANPFPHFVIDGFLGEENARALEEAYPSFEKAKQAGTLFQGERERWKLQVTNQDAFPIQAKQLSLLLASVRWLRFLSTVTGHDLIADQASTGGGLHYMGTGSRLDVHVDFNTLGPRPLHRRLNLLYFLNSEWQDEWGGAIELWDRDVKECVVSLKPIADRLIVFETSDYSWHGVEPINLPEGVVRKSFAAYYYTEDPPPGWDGTSHSTIYHDRPSPA
jgi:Rps23 Pro-64 3,4-dihydroxylase Tpa1-like proline 4-hydroxylase